jgi:hypothetical protein
LARGHPQPLIPVNSTTFPAKPQGYDSKRKEAERGADIDDASGVGWLTVLKSTAKMVAADRQLFARPPLQDDNEVRSVLSLDSERGASAETDPALLAALREP